MVVRLLMLIPKRKRIATDRVFDTKSEAHKFAVTTNAYFPGANARVVKNSERIEKMIP